jgi:hypothetical protein
MLDITETIFKQMELRSLCKCGCLYSQVCKRFSKNKSSLVDFASGKARVGILRMGNFTGGFLQREISLGVSATSKYHLDKL